MKCLAVRAACVVDFSADLPTRSTPMPAMKWITCLEAAASIGILLGLQSPSAAARSMELVQASATHYTDPGTGLLNTDFDANGNYVKETGDTYVADTLKIRLNGFAQGTTAVAVTGTTWQGKHRRLHDGAIYAVSAEMELVDSNQNLHLISTPTSINCTCEP
jgi:hypothetical protein